MIKMHHNASHRNKKELEEKYCYRQAGIATNMMCMLVFMVTTTTHIYHTTITYMYHTTNLRFPTQSWVWVTVAACGYVQWEWLM